METYTSKLLLNHQYAFNMIIITHKQIHGINKHNRDTYLDDEADPQLAVHHCNVPPNHRPVCSLISQHTSTPELGMISTRN